MKKKILLGLLPFWTPSIPPLGISCIKSHLQNHGYEVKTFDANMEPSFRKTYDEYFKCIQENIPRYHHGNFFNIGMDVLRNHMMAHFNQSTKVEYYDLINHIIQQTFFTKITDKVITQLNDILDDFYKNFKKFILEKCKEEKPDVFGLSVFSGNLPASVYAFKSIKEVFPEITTVLGGGTFSMELAPGNPNYDYLLDTAPYIDKFFVGEGENLFLRFLQGKLDKDKRVYTLSDIPKDNIQMHEAPTPDFSDFELGNYPQLGSWSSRSCPYQCSFCSETVHWGAYRKKKPTQVIDELEFLYNEYGTQIFMMGDSLLNIVVDGIAEEALKRNVPLYWDGYLRTDPPVCKTENTFKWRQGGMYRARLGVESGSQKILDIMNKKITIDQIRKSVRSLAEAGIKTTTYWIVGHPGETEKDFQLTLDLIEELQDDLWEAECNPFSYYLTGQVNSDQWMAEYERLTLYPEKYSEMLVTQTWYMKGCEPTRDKIYERVNRFVEHCKKLGIPNPYFEHEIFAADERWKKLQRNAVPSLIDFKNKGTSINESRSIQKQMKAAEVDVDVTEFKF